MALVGWPLRYSAGKSPCEPPKCPVGTAHPTKKVQVAVKQTYLFSRSLRGCPFIQPGLKSHTTHKHEIQWKNHLPLASRQNAYCMYIQRFRLPATSKGPTAPREAEAPLQIITKQAPGPWIFRQATVPNSLATPELTGQRRALWQALAKPYRAGPPSTDLHTYFTYLVSKGDLTCLGWSRSLEHFDSDSCLYQAD